MKPETRPDNNRKGRLLVGPLLAVAAFLVYLPVGTHPFLGIDDPDYVLNNPHVNRGLSCASLAWAFTHFHAGNWHPVTWISHSLDCQLFGLNPGAHHLVNAGFHALNSWLLLWVLGCWTGAFWRSALVAGLFALHPLHVESVAWLAERKDVLSAFFFFLTLGAYVRHVEVSSVRGRVSRGEGQMATESQWMPRNVRVAIFNWYTAALVFFALGLMSKPMVVTLPFVLLLLDYWPLGRIRRSKFKVQRSKFVPAASPAPQHSRTPPLDHSNTPSLPHSTTPIVRLLLEKLPFLALSAVSCVVTLLAQQGSGAVVSTLELALPLRLAHVGVGYVRYLKMAFAPVDLAIFYPLPESIPAWQMIGAGALLLAVTAVAVASVPKKPYLLFGWLWYLGMLVPVIGLVKAGEQAVADRYTYLPLVGIFIAVVWGVAEAARRSTRPLVFGAWCLVFPVLVLQTRRQLAYWKDTRTLCEHAIQVTRNNYFALAVLGQMLWREGNPEEAKSRFLEALQRAPHSPDLHTAVGSILVSQKRYAEARPHFEAALTYSPKLQEAAYGQALCLFQMGSMAEAEAACQRAWQIDPENIKAALLLALVLQQSAQTMGEAEAIYAQVLARPPVETSRAQSLEAGDRAQAHCSFAQLLTSTGRPADAAAQYRAALRCQPDLAVALNNLAWILATSPEAALRDGPEAINLAEKACRLVQDREPVFVGTLAAAYAEAGHFDKAVTTAEKARALAQQAGLTGLAERNAKLIELYRTQKAYREY